MFRIASFAACVLLLTATASAADLVAPPPVVHGPMPYNDLNPESITNGVTTLVAWDNSVPLLGNTRLCIRLLDDSQPCTNLGAGVRPRLATNGRDYLVAFSIGPPSRFSTVFDNVGVQLVSSDGKPGPRVLLNRSRFGAAGSAAWDGARWLVGYTSEESAYVTMLDERLERVATIAAGAGSIDAIVGIGGTFWAMQRSAARVDAVEIRRDGTAGARHSLDAARDALHAVPTARGALVFLRTANRTEVVTFDSSSGFGVPRTLVDARVLQDVEPYGGGAAVLTRNVDAQAMELHAVDAGGNVTGTMVLRPATVLMQGLLGSSRDGLLYFETRHTESSWNDVYVSRFAGLQILANAELLSVGTLAHYHSVRIVPNATGAVVFWERTVASGGGPSVFTRELNALGQPVGDVTELAIPFIGDIAFNGDHYVVVWWSSAGDIHAATISADGGVAGTPQFVGHGEYPSIAVRDGTTFVVWRDSSAALRGTNLDAAAAPVVRDGIVLLPVFAWGTPPLITAVDDGFLILWTALTPRALVISAAGTALRGYEMSLPRLTFSDVASSRTSALALAVAESGTLVTFGGNGQPFETFDSRWSDWTPLSVTTLANDRYLVAMIRNGAVFTSEVTMEGAFITDVTPLRLLGRVQSATALHGQPIGAWIDAEGVWVSTGPDPQPRRRAVRAR